MREKIRTYVKRACFKNWQRKGVALLSAMVLWLVVNSSITITKSYTNVPVKIINLPPDKTVEGLLPSGYLDVGSNLTLRGSKSALDNLDLSELEIVLDAYGKGEQWIADVNKKSIVSLNPDIDILHSVDKIEHSDFIIKLTKLITAKIPLRVSHPMGEAPDGYQFLDIWPQEFYHTVSGPQRFVEELRRQGMEITFNLDKIKRSDLDRLQNALPDNDEIFFFIPNAWKEITIPFLPHEPIEINDPNAYNLHIVFLRNEYLPISRQVPVNIFFPFKNSSTINPNTYSLEINDQIEINNGISVLSRPLFARNISNQFLEVVRDNLHLSVTAAPKSESDRLQWHINFVNTPILEDKYVEEMLPDNAEFHEMQPELHEKRLRERFREYVRHVTLFTKDKKELNLDITLQANTIRVDKASTIQ